MLTFLLIITLPLFLVVQAVWIVFMLIALPIAYLYENSRDVSELKEHHVKVSYWRYCYNNLFKVEWSLTIYITFIWMNLWWSLITGSFDKIFDDDDDYDL